MTTTGLKETVSLRPPDTVLDSDLQALQRAITREDHGRSTPTPSGQSGYPELLDRMGSGLYRLDSGGRLMFASPSLLRMLGCPTMSDVPRGEFRDSTFLTKVASAGRVDAFNSYLRRKDGSTLRVRESARVVRGENGEPAFYEGVVQDTSAECRATILQEDHRKVLDLIAKNFALDEVLEDLERLVEHQVAGAQCRIAIGKHSTKCSTPSATRGSVASAPLYTVLIQAGSGTELGAVRLYSEPHTACPDEEAALQAMDVAARLAAVAIQSRRLHDDLSARATVDPVTNLPNRQAFSDRLTELFRRGRSVKRVAVLWIELHRFRQINEIAGYRTGDILLRGVANRISGALERSEWLARVGDDQFAVVCDGAGRHEGENCARRLLQVLDAAFYIKNSEFAVRARIGIAVAPDDAVTAPTLQQNAALASSRSCIGYQFYETDASAKLREQHQVENELRRALPNRELVLYYQPQVALDGSVVGFESLLRWNHPRRGLLSPIHFLSVAEETGLIIEIGSWVIREACRQCMEWQRELGTPIKVAVNVSAHQFHYSNVVDVVRAALADSGLPACYLELELTETVIMRRMEESAKALSELRAMGVTVAIDDFGTGYSSLSYLQVLPADLLKIDRSFLQHVETPSTAAVVQAITTLAHSLHLRVAAEGVETENQLACIREFGVDLAQGYLFGYPVAPEEALDWLRTVRGVASQALAKAAVTAA